MLAPRTAAQTVLALSSLALIAGCGQPSSPAEPAADETEPTDAEQSDAVETEQAETEQAETDEVEEDDAAEAAESDSAAVADGTYESTGGYQSPNGSETIQVSITLAGGVISDVVVTPQPTNATTERYQGLFAGGIADEVVGKSLDEVEVSRVAGSSLTSGGFREALQTIRQDAQAG